MICRTRLLIPFLFLIISYACINNKAGVPDNPGHGTEIPAEEIKPDPVLLYGIPVDSFNIVTGKIRQNSFLSTILIQHGVPMQEIDMLIRNSSDVFDPRKIKSGNDYFLFCDKDTTGRAKYLVYEHDQSTSFIFSFNDSLNITPYYKEIFSEIRYASGTIETSLWDAMISSGLHPMLAVDLSEIYAWTIDFFGLQKGDSFKVLYEELSIDDESLGTGEIYGAVFTWAGNSYTAIPFTQGGNKSYFDTEGNSLRRAFLKAPLQYSRISSRYSASRLHPILRIRRPHLGVDYAAPVGTPVVSIGDGRVTSATSDAVNGRIVRIQHNSVYSTAYLHLSRFAPGIAAGKFVKQGEVIGFVGSTGLSTGPHLDFRFYKNGSPVDPLRVEAPPVEPVSDENMDRFEKSKAVILSLLETI